MVKTRSMALKESRIQASASAAGDRDLKRNKGSKVLRAKKESRSMALMESRIQASASEAGDRDLKRNQGSEILRTKKEMVIAFLDGVAEIPPSYRPRAGKRMKVVKFRLPQEFIDHSRSLLSSPILDELSEQELAMRSDFFRDEYVRYKGIVGKVEAYHRAILNQYDEKGYADDEKEVTDDDEEN